MNFFCKKEHINQWVTDKGIDKSEIFILDKNEGLIVSKMIFDV